jgi:hypothetical protein
MKHFILVPLLFAFALVACQKKNEAMPPSPPLPIPGPSSTPIPQSENYKKDLQQAQDDLKAEYAKLQEEKEKNASTLEAIAKTQGPRAEMISSLSEGSDVPVLIIAYGTSLNKLHSLENEINAAKSTNRPSLFSKINSEDHAQVYGEFLVEFNSVDKFKVLLDYSHRMGPDLKMLYFPTKNIVLRSYVQFSYKDPNPFKTEPIVNKTWIGDSSIAQINYLPLAYADIEAVLPYTAACEKFDENCLKELFNQKYFSNTSSVDYTSDNPLFFLQKNLKQAVDEFDQRGIASVKNYFGPMIQDLKLYSEVWVVYPDNTDLLDLSNVHNIAERAERYSSNIAIYQTPVVFEQSVPKFTTDNELNLNVAVHQLYQVVCKSKGCFNHN